MNKFTGGIALSLVIAMTLGACAPKEESTEEVTPEKDLISVNEDYLSAVDVDYAFDFTKSLEEFKTNEHIYTTNAFGYLFSPSTL